MDPLPDPQKRQGEVYPSYMCVRERKRKRERERERESTQNILFLLITNTLQNMVLIHTNVNLVVNNSPSYLNYGRPSITASTQSSCVGYQWWETGNAGETRRERVLTRRNMDSCTHGAGGSCSGQTRHWEGVGGNCGVVSGVCVHVCVSVCVCWSSLATKENCELWDEYNW